MNIKLRIKNKLLQSITLLILLPSISWALTFPLPSGQDNVVGSIQQARAGGGETLADVGRRFDIGYYEMIEANPNISSHRLLRPNSLVTIPSRFVLPHAKREGIVINLAELRLYYFPKGSNTVVTEPVGIGRVGWHTPLGTTTIISKRKNPSWRPTKRVREDAARLGYMLPDVWPPGPDNPLGRYAMRLGWSTFLIHGTHQPSGVGKRSSAGCIRMFPEDIEMLFNRVKVGTKVTVVNNPIKVGWQKGKFYLEAHKPLEEKGQFVSDDTVNMIARIHKATKGKGILIKWQRVQEIIKEQTGLPDVVGERGRQLVNLD